MKCPLTNMQCVQRNIPKTNYVLNSVSHHYALCNSTLGLNKSLSPFSSLSFAGLPPTFSFSLSFSCSIFQICGHDNLSQLNTLDNTDTETTSAFCFRLYLLFCCLRFQDAGGYAISGENNLELHLGYRTCWLRYFNLVCLWCGGRSLGRSVGRCTVTWLPDFLGWVDYFIYPWCSAPKKELARGRI